MIRKLPYINPTIIKKIQEGYKCIKTMDRATTILKRMIGYRIVIYNGKRWKLIHVNHKMIGHKVGEFHFY